MFRENRRSRQLFLLEAGRQGLELGALFRREYPVDFGKQGNALRFHSRSNLLAKRAKLLATRAEDRLDLRALGCPMIGLFGYTLAIMPGGGGTEILAASRMRLETIRRIAAAEYQCQSPRNKPDP